MKRSFKSYCQLLRLWSHHSSRLSSSKCLYHHGNIRTLVSSGNQQVIIPSASQHMRLYSERTYCTATEEEDEEMVPVFDAVYQPEINIKFRTQHDDPTKLTMDDIGLFYRVPHEDYVKYIESGQWEGYKKQVKTFQESVMMVRQPALEALDIIDNANYDYPPLRLFFYGKVGSGKSMSLSHVVQRCAKQDMLVIHIPDIASLIRYVRKVTRPHVMSDYTEGHYDLIDDAVNWLLHFKCQNEQLLKKLNLKTTKEYKWSLRESAVAGTDLLDILEFGLDRGRYASDCIGVIFKEIKKAATEKRVKVLVAIDGVNAFWKTTHILNQERKRVSAQEITTLQHFLRLFEPTWTNGICVGTLCPSIEALDNTAYENKMCVPYTPHYLLKQEGFDFMDPFIPILVPEYSHKEARNCIDYFIERKWIIKPSALTELGKKELMMLSNMNPYQLMKLSGRY